MNYTPYLIVVISTKVKWRNLWLHWLSVVSVIYHLSELLRSLLLLIVFSVFLLITLLWWSVLYCGSDSLFETELERMFIIMLVILLILTLSYRKITCLLNDVLSLFHILLVIFSDLCLIFSLFLFVFVGHITYLKTRKK